MNEIETLVTEIYEKHKREFDHVCISLTTTVIVRRDLIPKRLVCGEFTQQSTDTILYNYKHYDTLLYGHIFKLFDTLQRQSMFPKERERLMIITKVWFNPESRKLEADYYEFPYDNWNSPHNINVIDWHNE